MNTRNLRRMSCILILIGCSTDTPELPNDSQQDPDSYSADTSTDTTQEEPLSFCEGGVAALYEPLAGNRLDSLPDDFYTQTADTATGLRVAFGAPSWITNLPESYGMIYGDVEGLDGWGLNAGIHIRFDTEVSFEADHKGLGNRVGLYALKNGTARAIPFEVRKVSDGRATIFFPLVPLEEGTQHALIIRADALAPDVPCIQASDTLKALLTGQATDPKLTRLQPRYRSLLETLSLRADDIGAAVVFTTQTVTTQSVDAAEDVAQRDITWAEPPQCAGEKDGIRVCTGRYVGHDYRLADGNFASSPQDEWTIEVDVHLPVGTGPFPVVVYGHGIVDDRFTASQSAALLAPLGIAIIAIDAPHHGAHPTASSSQGDPIDAALGLLGADLDTLTLDTKQIRNNFRQATSDKLQMLRLLEQYPDIDGDGAADLDISRLGYHGVSLGGIMGPEFLALRPDIDVALLSVPGGRLSTLFADSEIMGLFLVLLQSLVDDKSDGDRLLPVAQTAIDAGDPASWGVHVLRSRLDDAAPPSVLLAMAYEDETIPMSATHALTRSLGVPVIKPVVADPLIVGSVEAPVTGNVEGASGGLFQFDRVRMAEDSEPERAKHNNTPYSYEAAFQTVHYFKTWLSSGIPEIIDPIAELNTPPK